jgi:tetratricopeptide (TPR) repeat protein
LPQASKDDYDSLLRDIRTVMSKLAKLGKQKGIANKKYMILLYAATSIEGLKIRGSLNKKDGYRYFSIHDLGEIANDKDNIIRSKSGFDKDTAKKIYEEATRENFIRCLPREDISEEICNGDTSPIAITTEGKEYSQTIIIDYSDELPSQTRQIMGPKRLEHKDEKETYRSFGLDWLNSEFFEFHKTTEKDFDNWKKGFRFELPSIKAGRELRRKTLIADIKSKLENDGKLLILGKSGSSKSTILMELMCDYFDAGYEILYNNGVTDIKNTYGLVNFIENRLRNEKKILVAIDDAHHERARSIFYVLDKVSNSQLTLNLRFIVAARLPEFDWLLERLDSVQEEVRKSIRKLVGDPKFRYYLPNFSRDEIKDFMRLYLVMNDDDVTDKKSHEIYDYTKGDPIMVKFSVFGQGLEQDVEEMYDRYLRPHLEMKTMLTCSLLDTSNIEITDKILELCGVLAGAYHLNGSTLYRNSESSWRTKHPRWDQELFTFLYNKKSGIAVEHRKQDLKDSLIAIYNIKAEDITYSVVSTLYKNAAQNIVPIDMVESVFQESISQKPTWLNEGICHHQLGGHKQAIYCYDKALEFDPNNGNARDLKDRALAAANRWKTSMSITWPTESENLKVLSDTSYIESVGSFHVVGEVGSAKLVMVIGTFYDANGTVVGTSSAYTDLQDLIPGDRAPFHLIFTSASTPASQIKHYSLQLKLE